MNAHIKFFIKKLIQSFFPSSIYLSKTKFNGIIISFDDGPHPQHTPHILSTLSKKNIKGIFFVTGKELEKYPEMGKLIVQHGHMLGNHTYEHLDLKKCPFDEYIHSIENTYRTISSFQDAKIKIFRPPYGRFSLKLLSYIVSSKTIMMNWTVDSRDSFIRDPEKLTTYVKSLPVNPGDILLFHEDYAHTMTALSQIIEYLTIDNVFYDPKQLALL